MKIKSIKQTVLTVISLIVFAGNLFGQSKEISLWNGKIPGAIAAKTDYKETIDSENNWTKMRFITTPRLDMYPAPADKATGTAVIICPGGGYWGVAVKHEGKEIAEWLNELGITAFVLKYRLPDDAIMVDKSIAPMQDGQQAIRLVRTHAKEWGINPDKIGIMGFSAGGHLAATLSTHFNEKVYESVDTTSARPDFSLLIYPVISMDETITHAGSRYYLLGKNPSPEQVKRFSNELQVNSETPPAFLVHCMDDGTVPVENSVRYAMAMQKQKIPCELHLYQSGGHGFGLAISYGTVSAWRETCSLWLKSRGF
jgi:acetyl esterase/lipase